MCVFHKWTKWKEYERELMFTPGILAPKAVQGKMFKKIELWQKRHCEKCGKSQHEMIRSE